MQSYLHLHLTLGAEKPTLLAHIQSALLWVICRFSFHLGRPLAVYISNYYVMHIKKLFLIKFFAGKDACVGIGFGSEPALPECSFVLTCFYPAIRGVNYFLQHEPISLSSTPACLSLTKLDTHQCSQQAHLLVYIAIFIYVIQIKRPS